MSDDRIDQHDQHSSGEQPSEERMTTWELERDSDAGEEEPLTAIQEWGLRWRAARPRTICKLTDWDLPPGLDVPAGCSRADKLLAAAAQMDRKAAVLRKEAASLMPEADVHRRPGVPGTSEPDDQETP